MKNQIPLRLIVATVLLSAPAVFAADRYVDDNDVTCGGNSPCYSTITAALAAVAVDGEEISVAAGTYSENPVITQPVDLIGAGSGVTTLVAGNTSLDYLIFLGTNTVSTFTQGMVIEGFTFKGPLDGDEDLIQFRAESSDPNDPIIVRNNVFDCELDHRLKGIETRGGGFTRNVVIDNNEFINECAYSMFLNSAINWLIQNNDFDSSWTSTIQINTGATDQTHDIDILDNTFSDSSLRTDIGSFPGSEQFFAAIGLGSTVYNVNVSGNTIIDGGNHSIAIGDRSTTVLTNVVISCNDILSSSLGTLQELPATVLDAENNYWGAANGPSGVGPGTGDAVTTGFDFDPFLTTNFGPACPTPPVVPSDSPLMLVALGLAFLVALLTIAGWKLRSAG